jgi:uncharacterized protein YdhG (YjbR/CyaY superfamily)
MKNRPASVDGYIAAQPEPAREALKKVRATIQKAVPKAEECISYNIPTYKLGDEIVLYFAGWKKHYSLYPANAKLVAAFKDELSSYLVEKATVRFLFSDPVPLKLIRDIAKFRAKEIASGR